nr:hypothetical protein [uncultured Flavobacterium sp.]
MKKLEFETSKGRFVIKGLNFIPLNCNGIKLSEITEEQASEVVGSIKELHSLLKSKGIYLFENPYGEWFSDFKNANDELDWQLAEQKTFYNPYIFKL